MFAPFFFDLSCAQGVVIMQHVKKSASYFVQRNELYEQISFCENLLAKYGIL
jgi:hypothetical protein